MEPIEWIAAAAVAAAAYLLGTVRPTRRRPPRSRKPSR